MSVSCGRASQYNHMGTDLDNIQSRGSRPHGTFKNFPFG